MIPLLARVHIVDAYGAEAWGTVSGYGQLSKVYVDVGNGIERTVSLLASWFTAQPDGHYLVDMAALGLQEPSNGQTQADHK